MTEMMGIVLDAVGFGIGLIMPYILSWLHDEIKRSKRIKRREVRP